MNTEEKNTKTRLEQLEKQLIEDVHTALNENPFSDKTLPLMEIYGLFFTYRTISHKVIVEFANIALNDKDFDKIEYSNHSPVLLIQTRTVIKTIRDILKVETISIEKLLEKIEEKTKEYDLGK